MADTDVRRQALEKAEAEYRSYLTWIKEKLARKLVDMNSKLPYSETCPCCKYPCSRLEIIEDACCRNCMMD